MRSEVITKTLKNKLKLIHIKNKQKSVKLAVYVKVGAQNENKNNNGVSHFVEHMLWQSSKNYDSIKIRSELKKTSADTYYNAFTTYYKTAFYIKGPRRYFEKYVSILSDILINPLFKENEIEKERKVILDEYNRIQDNVNAIINSEIHEKIFQNNTLSKSIIGTKPNILKFKRKDLINFYKKYYTADNIQLVVNGDIENPFKILKKYFKLSNSQTKRVDKITKANFINKNYIVKIKKEINSTYLTLGFPMAGHTHKDSVVFEVINNILNNGKNINLIETIREKLGLTYIIYSLFNEYPKSSVFTINTTTPNNKLEFTKRTILKEINKLENIDLKELKYIKNNLSKKYKKVFRIPEFVEMVTVNSNFFKGYKEMYYNRANDISKVTVDDIKKIYKKYFKNYVAVVIEPKNIN